MNNNEIKNKLLWLENVYVLKYRSCNFSSNLF